MHVVLSIPYVSLVQGSCLSLTYFSEDNTFWVHLRGASLCLDSPPLSELCFFPVSAFVGCAPGTAADTRLWGLSVMLTEVFTRSVQVSGILCNVCLVPDNVSTVAT